MKQGKAVELATRCFPTQSAATAFYKEMLSRYKPGDRVSDADALDLTALLERHDELAQKVGTGIDHFSVMMTEHGTPCFRIERKDGTGTDFSYRHCITRRPPSRKQEVSHAFRRAVRFDLYQARDAFFAEHKDARGTVACAETGERITREQGHMDHRPPMTFEVIVTTFLVGRGMTVDAVSITSGKDEQVSPEITDQGLAEDFRRYHAEVAGLDFVSVGTNLSQSGKHRMRPTRIRIA
jgi:hypothetical protein